MKRIRYILYILVVLLFATACSDDVVLVQSGTENPLNLDKGIGELVLFSTGNAGNATTRAEVCPYMELDGRFVCKMYYHAKATDTDASPFDTISTPITSWLRVNNDEGNSVYWQKDYDMSGVDKSHQDYKDYGFDSRAQYFYWRNRLDHIFLGFTDYNKLKTNTYGNTQGKLFMYPERDGEKRTKVGEEKVGDPVSYKKLVFEFIPISNPEYNPEDAERLGVEYTVPPTIEKFQFRGIEPIPSHPGRLGVSFPLSGDYYLGIDNYNEIRANTKTKIIALINNSEFSDEVKTALIADINRGDRYSEEENTVEGTFRNDRWWITYDPETPDVIVDNTIDLTKAVVYQVREKVRIEDIIATAPANTFDLTRGTKTSMAEQPDPLIALTKMKPTGATQEANRVRLHFKHQFSQIQVNLVNAENTAEITAENIVSVELLGVTKKGYVFTNINPDGTQIPPSYDPVIISQYTEEQLKENPHGTSFNMFDMKSRKPVTSLKSFNAIAFGQLQAIRITWQEEATGETYTDETAADENAKYLVADSEGRKPDEDGYTPTYKTGYTPVRAGDVVPPVKHVATYKITVDDRGNSLVNLRSGFRYMYDFELRRGTIAFIRATIDGWLLDDDLDFNTSGTINE